MRLFVFSIILFSFTGFAFAQSESTPDCIELLETRCQSCHYLSRVCQKVGEKSKRRWKATLKRMVKRRGATLNEDEQKVLLACLAPPSPEMKKTCGK